MSSQTETLQAVTLYEASVPVFRRMLGNLLAILEKAEANAEARKIDLAVFAQARLAPDMFPLVRQIQIATDNAKGAAARLAGVEVPSYEDTETSFTEIKARIHKTIDFIGSVPEDAIRASAGRTITLKLPSRELSFSAPDYLFHFALPNFYFHVTTAYAILRHNGVDIGKLDFLGAIG